MNSFSFCVVFLGSILISSQLYAEKCVEPADILVTDGSKATRDKMASGKTEGQRYIADMEKYLKCLRKTARKEDKLNSDKSAEKQRQADMEHYDAVLKKIEDTTQAYNNQISTFKAANPRE